MPPHVLILPTEEFLPPQSPLAGIFQGHQLEALRMTGNERFGVLSVRLRHSVPMYLRSILRRLTFRPADPALPAQRLAPLTRHLLRRWFRPASTISEEEWQGVPVLRIEGLYGLPPSRRLDPIWWQRAGWAAYRDYRDRFGRPDLVHAHNTVSAGLLAARIRRHDGVPYIITEHSSAYHQDEVPKALFPAIRRAIEGAAAYLPVSRALLSSVTSRIGAMNAHTRIVGNVLPRSFLDIERRERTDGPFTFLTVGSLLAIKNQALLLAAFAETLEQRPDCRLRIVGDGPLRRELEEQAEAAGISGKVTFCGQLESDGVRAEMLQADAFVFPSRFETFGVVLIEAMACGLPVIAMASGGPEVIVDRSNGRLVTPGDMPGLVDMMAGFASGTIAFDRPTIRQAAIERWGPVTFCRQLREIHAQAVGARDE